MPATNSKKNVLAIIVISQFAGTSIWFVGNAVLPELKQALQLSQYSISLVTSAVMLGFVAGTLVFAFFSLADRFSPVRLFFISSVLGGLTNAAVVWLAKDAASLFSLRFATGFFLAGIYPVGMKIAADWYKEGLGKALGFLVGALVLGTAFPHLLRNADFKLPWKSVLYSTSAFAVTGGALMLLFVGDGPFRKTSGKFQFNAIVEIFRSRKWRQAAFGYFGHMWEVYALWGFLPLIIGLYVAKNNHPLNISLISFFGIAIGSIACVVGGYLSRRHGSAKIATISLFISGACCLISPLIFNWPLPLFLLVIFIWGSSAVADSPQMSTLVAQYAPPDLKGTALTIYNSIGFLVASASLFIIDRVYYSHGFFGQSNCFLLLGLGALTGLPFISRLISGKTAE